MKFLIQIFNCHIFFFKELFNANAEKINDFFKDMDRSETANTSSDLFLDRHREQQQLSSSGVSDAPAPRLAPKVGECDYDLMLRLTGQWGKWTGNVPISHDMQRIGVGKGGRGAATSESAEFIKIPFKPFIWQKGGRLKGQLATDTNIHATESSASPEEMHPPGFAGAHARSHGCTTTAEELLTESLSPVQHQGAFQQAAYGATHYEVPMESPYWENLTLTECLMASPYFQHLTSDKFRALDHFAVARSYNDQDTVLEQHQKFYSVYFVRYKARENCCFVLLLIFAVFFFKKFTPKARSCESVETFNNRRVESCCA